RYRGGADDGADCGQARCGNCRIGPLVLGDMASSRSMVRRLDAITVRRRAHELACVGANFGSGSGLAGIARLTVMPLKPPPTGRTADMSRGNCNHRRPEFILIAFVGLAALLNVELILTFLIPNTNYSQSDGWMAKAIIHTALTFGRIFHV